MLDYGLRRARLDVNTPPVFSIYVSMLVTRWLRRTSGAAEPAARNREKAGLLYAAIDEREGFYRGHADAGRGR